MKFRRSGDQSGTAVVEGAIVLIVLLVFLFGLMEAGHLFQVYQTLAGSAREGARLAVAPLSQTSTLPTDDQIIARVRTFLESAGITNADIAITHPIVAVNGTNTEFTKVRVEAPYKPITLTIYGLQNMPLRGEALMRNETSP
jgi:Flp pilus assembly protein TadG